MSLILVTGCAGFIGWKVSQLLLDQDDTVVGVDNLSDAYDPRLKRWRLGTLEGKPEFSFHQLDISEENFAERMSQDIPGPIDAVIDLAARAGVRDSTTNPRAYYDANVTGALNLLEMCRTMGVPKFVLASTSSVYGNSALQPFREDLPTDRPLSPYAASKKAAEALCHVYSHLHGLDVTVLRYFTVYGPAGRPDMSIYRFVRWMIENEPVVVYGDGSQQRDFSYVGDIALGTVLALKPVGFEVINLGSDRPVAVGDVIRRIEGLLGAKARINNHPPHPADVPATWADVTKARAILGWEPETSLDKGLEQSVKWYQENRSWAKEVCWRDAGSV